MEILDLLNEESVSGARSGRAKSINSTRSPTANVRKGELISKVRFKYFFRPQAYIGECGSTLYVGLSGIVRNLIQKSTG